MAFSNITMHTHPTFTASGSIDTSGNYSLTVNATDTSGSSSYGYTMTLYIVFNDGTYISIGSFTGYSSHSYSGKVTTTGKTSAQFSMHCTNKANSGSSCNISSDADTVPGYRFGSVFTLYKAPSNISLKVVESSANSITTNLSWTEGTKTGTGYVAADLDGESAWLKCSKGVDFIIDQIVVNGDGSIKPIKSNTYYIVYGAVNDGTIYRVDDQQYWTHPLLNESTFSTLEGFEGEIINIKANIDVASSYDQYRFKSDYDDEWSEYQSDSEYMFMLESNSKYELSAQAKNIKSGFESEIVTGICWTYPEILKSTLTLVEGFEYSQIHVVGHIFKSSDYDQYRFKLGDGDWTEYQDSPEYTFTGLIENTEYEIFTQIKNTESGYESTVSSDKITTWFNPLTNLEVVLENRWFWYLDISSDYDYNGTIDKYEFHVGDNLAISDEDIEYQDMLTINDFISGSLDPFDSKKLKYNTEYLCAAKLTDNHGRVYFAKTTYKTMDERTLYVDGILREVKVILPDNSIHYITPNLLTVINDDKTTVNMNKIINNDDRIEFQ